MNVCLGVIATQERVWKRIVSYVEAVLMYQKKQVRQRRRKIGVQDKQSYLHTEPQSRNTREYPDGGVTAETATATCECAGDKERKIEAVESAAFIGAADEHGMCRYSFFLGAG